MPSTAETDAEDVNDFLKRIQELGIKRDQEDEERNKKLEEEILQGRKERQARRAERARSISPIKDSPTNTPPPYKPASAETRTQSPNAALTPSRELQRPSQLSNREQPLGDTMGRLTGEDSPTKDYGPSAISRSSDAPEKNVVHTISVRASPSSAMPSRSPTLSWQRRPNSQSPARSSTRPFSMIAGETTTRSPIEKSEPPPGDAAPMDRNEIAQSLAAKDPTWFRQTSDRGQGSAAYRKTQVEVKDVDEAIPNIHRVGLPGMSRTPKREYSDSSDVKETKQADIDRSSPPSRASSSKDSITQSSAYGSTKNRTGFVSPMPATSAQRFPQPGSITSSEGNIDQPISTRSLAMSPSQGRISPERMDRPISPTKGMGGFVQSAMMKRSDSVNKRWSVQSPGGLTRGNSTVSNRSSQDLSSRTPLGNILNSPTREPRPSSLSRENTPLSTSRPSSSHSNATVGLEGARQGRSGAQWGSESEVILDGDFVKPGIPASQLQAPSDAHSGRQVDRPENSALSGSPPPSPPKSTDTRRWSPTKSSWLESALNKPDSPKPKPAPPPQQPSWMSEISKAKQKIPTAETSNRPSGHKHQVSIGGLLRSPPMGGIAMPLSVGGLPAGFSSGTFPTSQSNKVLDATPKTKTDNSDVSSKVSTEALETASSKKTETKPTAPLAIKPSSPVIGKTKPETPPKKDFISYSKPKQVLSPTASKDEPEFKNVFGQLRRTKTQNYVAPDELKDNILRGKAGLSLTGGPKKTERRDEFKDAILKKKEDFKKAQSEGTGVTKSTTSIQTELPEALRKKAQLGGIGATQSTLPPVQAQLPEALLKKANLGRVNTVVSGTRDNSVSDRGLSDTLSKNNLPYNSPKPRISPEAGSPTASQGKLDAGGKFAGRFNPALAGILARGPPPKPAGSSRKVSSNLETASRLASKGPEKQDSGPQLTHMTKGRARGPRRKAPSAIAQGKAQSEAAISPLKSSGSPFISSSPLERRSTAPVS
ncbi:hypothetical protein V500_09445 [Pseudogymnoascus sp. VKM F-4518 (FW-2643)]|nr:hypothetical protein V500_09445 [Pseudogymnoascus sp. VKM F-4518 (FW-2643)]